MVRFAPAQKSDAPTEKAEFYIEKNVPVPKRFRECIYPFAEMKVGDSFFAKDVAMGTLRSSATSYKIRNGLDWKFTVRTVEGGSHVWRVA